MDKTFDDIKDMLKANYPLLYLATSEYGRALQKLRRIAYEMDYAFYSWDNVDGLQSHVKNQSNRLEKVEKHKAHQETKGYQELLEYIKRDSEGGSSKKEIYVVEDFHKYFKDDKVIVYLRKLTNILKSYDKHLVLMSPFLKLPDELEKYVNDCLRSVAAIIKTEKRLEDRITMLENRFELLEPELKFEEVF